MAKSFVDAGEYGIALEDAVAVLAEFGAQPSDILIGLIESLAKTMQMDATALIGQLPATSR